MKNILAENMLRFGVKNLNNLNISNIKNMLFEGTTPVTEGPVKGPFGKGDKTDPKYWLISFSTTYESGLALSSTGTTVMNVKGTVKSFDQKTWFPQVLYIDYVQGGYDKEPSKTGKATLYYNTKNGTFDTSNNLPTNWPSCAYNGPGNKPVTAVNLVLASMKTKTGKTILQVPADVSTGLQSMKNNYERKSPEVTAKGIFGNNVNSTKWTKRTIADPETDAAIGTAYLRCETLKVTPDANGSFSKTTKLYDYSGMERTTIETFAAAIALKNKTYFSNLIDPSYFSEDKNVDKSAIERQLIYSLGDIYATAAIAEPVKPEDKGGK